VADGRKNNGGHSTKGKAGRPAKSDELKKLEMMDAVAAPEEVWYKVWELVQSGDMQAVKVWVEHRFGKPKETKDITTNGNDINLTPISFVD